MHSSNAFLYFLLYTKSWVQEPKKEKNIFRHQKKAVKYFGTPLILVSVISLSACDDYESNSGYDDSFISNESERQVKEQCNFCGGIWYYGDILFMDDYHKKGCQRSEPSPFLDEY